MQMTDNELIHIKQKCFELLCFAKSVLEKEKIWYSLACGTILGAVRHNGFIPWDSDVDLYVMLPDKDRVRKAFTKYISNDMYYINFDVESRFMSSHDKLIMCNEVKEAHLDLYFLCGAPSGIKEQRKFAMVTSYADRIIRSKYNKLKDCKKKNRPLVLGAKIIDYCFPDKMLKNYIAKREYRYDFESADYIMPMACIPSERACMPKSFFEETIMHEFNGEFFPIPKDFDAYLRQMYGEDYMTPKQY